MLFPANIIILLFLVSCTKAETDSLTLSADTIIFWCLIVFLICALLTYLYLYSHVKDLTEAERKETGFGYFFKNKFYEILGFVVSAFALTFAIFSMINSEKLDSAQLQRPIFKVNAVKYKYQQENELKIVIRVNYERIPHDCRIEFLPIFRLEKDTGGESLTGSGEDFSHSVKRTFELTKDKEEGTFKSEISGLMKYMCGKPAFKSYCTKVTMGEGRLVEIYYRIFYRIGYSDVIETKRGKINVPR